MIHAILHYALPTLGLWFLASIAFLALFGLWRHYIWSAGADTRAFEPPAQDVRVPAEFWRELSARDYARIVRDGYLDAPQCLRVWEILDRSDPVPSTMPAFLTLAEVCDLNAYAKERRRAF